MSKMTDERAREVLESHRLKVGAACEGASEHADRSVTLETDAALSPAPGAKEVEGG